MRMWNINPKKLCNQHLLGEHAETHMFVRTINKNKSVKGYLDKGLLEIHNLKKRHDLIASEMKRRGMNHKSPLPKYKITKSGKIDKKTNKKDLSKRCKECRSKLNKK